MNAKLWLDILNQDFDVTGYDLVALQKMLLSTSEIVTFDNAVCKYLGYDQKFTKIYRQRYRDFSLVLLLRTY
jgi:hypothetical protein